MLNSSSLTELVEVTYDKNKSIDMALKIRTAFFVDGLDIGCLDNLYDLIESDGLNRNSIEASINNGSAMAALMHDYQKSKQQTIKGSPSFVINEGRQTLYGNVGYRVLLANVEELLRNPKGEASWC